MLVLDLRLRATTANSCKSPSIMRGYQSYHAPLPGFKLVAHTFQATAKKSPGKCRAQKQHTSKGDVVHKIKIDACYHVLFIHSNVEINHTLKKR